MAPSAPFAGARFLLRRLLSTATEGVAEAATPPAQAAATQAAKKGGRPLYRQLSALGKAGEGSVSQVMNKWVREGGAVRVDDLVKHVRDLRKYKRHAHALEVCKPQPFPSFVLNSDSSMPVVWRRNDAILHQQVAIAMTNVWYWSGGLMNMHPPAHFWSINFEYNVMEF
jgi:hypothetical protein